MSSRSWSAVFALSTTALAACDGSGSTGETDPGPANGTCHARVDGQTVDIVDVDDVGAGASLDGSTLGLTCGQNTQTGGGSSYETRMSFSIKAFDGPGDYLVDHTEMFGSGDYSGNDGTSYSTFKPSSGGPDSFCNISVTKADDKHVAGTFSCSDLHGFVNDAQGACCDSVYVNLTEGTFDLPFPTAD